MSKGGTRVLVLGVFHAPYITGVLVLDLTWGYFTPRCHKRPELLSPSGVIKTPSEVHGTERNQGVFLS
jgi:hypothetical protein